MGNRTSTEPSGDLFFDMRNFKSETFSKRASNEDSDNTNSVDTTTLTVPVETNTTSNSNGSDHSEHPDGGGGFTSTPGIYIYCSLIILAVVLILALVVFFLYRAYKKRIKRKNIQDNFMARNQSKTKLGTVEYILQYNYLEARLSIEVLQVKNITFSTKQQKDVKEIATYMRAYLVPDMNAMQETKIVTRSLSPFFGQVFTFKCLIDDLDKRKILLRLYQHHKFLRDMPVGDAMVELKKNNLRLGFASVPMYAYNPALDDPLGEICFSLRYNPNTSKLSVTIIECKKLKAMDWNGKADPYVKITIRIKDKVVFKDKTEIQKSTLNPYYNTIFSFKIPPNKIPLVDMTIQVKDYDLLGANEEIGSVRLGMEPDSETAERQWNNMIENLKRPQTEWHHLMPLDRSALK